MRECDNRSFDIGRRSVFNRYCFVHRRIVVLCALIEFDIAVDGNDVPDSVKDNPICRIRSSPFEGYGKLSSWDRIAERADAILIAANVSHVRHSDSSISSGREASRRLPI